MLIWSLRSSPAKVVQRWPGWITTIAAIASAAAGGMMYVFSALMLTGLRHR